MKKLNILITGVAGLVGSNLALELSKTHNVVGIDNLSSGYEDNIPENIKFIKADCNDLTLEYFNGIDIVIHAACYPYEGLSVFSPKLITNSVFSMSMNVLTCSIQAKVPKFIYLSSMARYGQDNVVPFLETYQPKPVDPYGIAKVAFENTLISLHKIHNFNYTIIVPHNIVGTGQNYTDPYRNVAGIMINKMLQGIQPIIYGDGEQKRCFSDIRDVVEPICKIINSNICDNQIINIGPDKDYISINDLAKKISQIIKFNLKPIYLPARPMEVKYANCSAEKARRVLNYNPRIEINDILDNMIKYVKQRGPQPFNYHLPVEIVNDMTPKPWIKGRA